MKKRKIAIVAFMLAAILALGVGFAALTDTLTIEGSAKIAADGAQEVFDEDIFFSKALADTTRCTAAIDGTDKDKATMTVLDGVLKGTGSNEVIATYSITSTSDRNVVITPSISNLDTDHFQVTTSWNGSQTLAAGATTDIVITVKCIKTPDTDVSTTFTITLDVASTN